VTRAELLPYIRSLPGPILITGSSGLIGASLYNAIAAERADVFGVEKSGRRRAAGITNDDLIAVDLTDRSAVKNLLNNVTPQTVFDCVAYGAHPAERDVDRIYETNVQSVIGLAGQLAQRSISAFVHAGSSTEDVALEPNSHFAVSKRAIASYLRYMGRHHAFPCANLRLDSVYGPLDDTSGLIPNLLREALAGGYPEFADARTVHDFVHVDDVCAAFIVTAAKMNPQIYGASFDIGTGDRTTIAELAALTKRIFALQADPRLGEGAANGRDAADSCFDPTSAHEVLGWRADVSLEAGLRSTAQWVGGLDAAQRAVTAGEAFAKQDRSLSAIVACYKDGQAIPVMYRRLTDTFRKLGVDYEIIFVNDASPDDSAEVIRQLSDGDHHVIGISHSRNFGSQMAFRSGMEIATKDGVVLLDGDLQDPPELIEDFYAKWEQGCDVIYGRRIKRDMNFLWNAAYKLFYRVFAAFSYVPIPLDAGDFSLMDRKVVEWLLRCPERDLFVRGLRAYVGFRQDGVDYVRPDRSFGHSTNNIFKNIEWAKKGIFSFSNTPLTMLTTAGVISVGVSLLVALISLSLRLFFPNSAPRGATTILIAILLFGSFNLFAIGLVGEYIAKIMTEVKGRPRLIRAALIRDGTSTELLPDGKLF